MFEILRWIYLLKFFSPKNLNATKYICSLKRRNKIILQIVYDVLVLTVAYIVCVFIHDLSLREINIFLLVISVMLSVSIFIISGDYKKLFRLSFQDGNLKAIKNYVLAATIFFVVSIFFNNDFGLQQIFFMSLFGSTLSHTGRTLIRFVLDKSYIGKVNTLIIGADKYGLELLRSARIDNNLCVVGIIDDQKEVVGSIMAGVKVYPEKEIHRIVENKKIKVILLTSRNITKNLKNHLSELQNKFNLNIRELPKQSDILSGTTRIVYAKNLDITDLLGRDPVPANFDLIQKHINGKSILITGAGGSIGTEISRQITKATPSRLVLFDHSEFNLYTIEQEIINLANVLSLNIEIISILGSVCDEELFSLTLSKHMVEHVYHAAAYKHVPLLEKNVCNALYNNVIGTRNVLRTSLKAGVQSFTMVSTDKAVRPTNVMGASKRLAELICQAYANAQSKTIISMVRFGNVMNSSGSVIPLFQKQIMNGGPLTVTHPEITRFFMTIPEAAQLVVESSCLAEGGEVFLLDMGDPIKISNLAASMITLSGYEVYDRTTGLDQKQNQIEIIYSGLRDAEKLFEELLIDASSEKTKHSKIMKAKESFLHFDLLDPILNEFAIKIQKNNVTGIIEMLNDLPLGYKKPDQ